jgi:glycosyltransferase involved in cell wall biosynthesis
VGRDIPGTGMTPSPSLDIGVFGARSIPSSYSGYETFLTTMLPRLAARGHRVTMYCRSGATDGEGPYEGVERVVLPAVPGKQLNTLSHGAVAAVRARLARHDVVLVVNVANAVACGFCTASGQAVVLNVDGQEWLRGKWGRAARWYFWHAAQLSRRTATALVADCGAMAAVYEREFGAVSTVIPYCFPAPSFQPDDGVPARFGVETDCYAIIAGRLNPENNIDAVVGAYVGSDIPAPLLVLGEANYDSPVRHRLEELAGRDERVRLVGHVADRATFLSLVGLAAVYFHAHSVGGMNPSLVEAMGAGALVAALDTPFNRETLGGTGSFFATPGEAPVVARELGRLPADERRRRRESTAQRVADQFGVDDVTSAYEALLHAAATGAVRRGLRLPTRWA